MSRVSFLEKLLDGVHVEWKTLAEVVEFKRGEQLKPTDIIPGPYPIVTASKTEVGLLCEWNFGPVSVTITSHGAYAGHVNYWPNPIWLANNVFLLLPSENLIPKFLYYYLKSNELKIQSLAKGGGVPYFNTRDVAPFPIPVPCLGNPKKSLEIQAEIVRILDTFTSLTAELTAELNTRKQQYNYYRDELLSFHEGNAEWKALGEIGEFIRGKRFTKADYVEDGISVIHYGEIYTRYGAFATRAFSQVRSEMADLLRYAKPGDVVMAGVGETVEEVGKAVAWLGEDKVAIHDDSYAFRHSMNPKFIAYVMQTAKFVDEKTKHVSRGKLNRLLIDGVAKIKIPIPYPDDPEKSLAEQSRIVAILDKFDALTNSLIEGLPREIALRQKQYEYYRGMLLNFPKPKEMAA